MEAGAVERLCADFETDVTSTFMSSSTLSCLRPSSGPGAFAPYPAYEESAIPVYRYHHRHQAYEETRVAPPMAYGEPHNGYRWGASSYYHGRRVLRRYY